MGSGSWTRAAYATYCCSTGKTYNATTDCINENYTSTAQAFKSCKLNEALDPKNVIRECCDSKEHPESLPIILALDVTGSMGDTAIRIQKLLNPIMTKIYEEVKDAEIAIMAIGDLACDDAPIQMSQFESDIRIADNLDKIYFERGGGGNTWESYTAAWYMGLKHTKLDCWKRGRKGIIITMGDEKLNPYLPLDGYSCGLRAATGDSLQADVERKKLYKDAKDIGSALKAFEKAQRDPETKQKSIIEHGACYMIANRLDNAAIDFQRAIELDKSNTKQETLLARYFLATCCE